MIVCLSYRPKDAFVQRGIFNPSRFNPSVWPRNKSIHHAGYNSSMGISLSNDEILGIGFFTLVLLGVAFAFIDNRRERADRDKPLPIITTFRVPWGGRLFMAFIAFACIAGYPLIYVEGFFNSRGHRPVLTADAWLLFGLLEMIGIAVGIPIFYAAGPNDFFLDIDRRTYRHVYGWPFRPRTREGSWGEWSASMYGADRGIFSISWASPGNTQEGTAPSWECSADHAGLIAGRRAWRRLWACPWSNHRLHASNAPLTADKGRKTERQALCCNCDRIVIASSPYFADSTRQAGKLPPGAETPTEPMGRHGRNKDQT